MYRVVDFVIPFMPLSNKENFIGTVWDPDSEGSWLNLTKRGPNE